MKNENYESFSSSSISTDSLEISTKSIISRIPRVVDNSKSKFIREYSSEQNLNDMKKNSSKSQQQSANIKTPTPRQRIPIRKRSCTRLATRSSNCENVNTNTKVDQETNTAIPVYPEIIVKHCHNNKVIEKVIPAIDGPRITKPKTYLEIVQHGDKNGKLNISPIGRNKKSYLEIFQSRNGSIRTATANGTRSRVGDTPRDYGDICLKKHTDNDSLYSKDCPEKESQIRYPSQASSIYTVSANSSDSLSRTSSLLHTSSGLTSISEQVLLVKKGIPRTTKTLTQANNKKNGLKIIKSESDSTKEKLEKFIRQREYGQTVSNRNRIKIIQNNIKNSECKPVSKELTPSKSCTIKRDEFSPKTLQQKKIIVNKKPDNIKMVDMSIGTDDLEHTLKIEQTPKKPYLDRKKDKNIPVNVVHQRGTLKTLQTRHLKELEIVEKLRNTTL